MLVYVGKRLGLALLQVLYLPTQTGTLRTFPPDKPPTAICGAGLWGKSFVCGNILMDFSVSVINRGPLQLTKTGTISQVPEGVDQ